MRYEAVELKDAYALQNAGGLVLVCTKGSEGRYDLAPVAWCCPLDYEPVSRMLCVLDTGHKTLKDLRESGEFVLALPSSVQMDLVVDCGSVSGFRVDKYEKLGIQTFRAKRVDALIPEGVAGWLECRLSEIVVRGTSAIVLADVVHAEAEQDSWKRRIHFVDEETSFVAGDRI